jgi:hypothetical protein
MWYLNDYGTEMLDKYYLGEEEHDKILEEVVYSGRSSSSSSSSSKKRKRLNSWNFVGSKLCREFT